MDVGKTTPTTPAAAGQAWGSRAAGVGTLHLQGAEATSESPITIVDTPAFLASPDPYPEDGIQR